MAFENILFPEFITEKCRPVEDTLFLSDLNLDRVIDSTAAGLEEEYGIKKYFYSPLQNREEIIYRQEIMKDLEKKPLVDYIKAFSSAMHNVRSELTLSKKLYYKENKEGWFLEATKSYFVAVKELSEKLSSVELNSRGLNEFKNYLAKYTNSKSFSSLGREIEDLSKALGSVSFSININGSRIRVCKCGNIVDYSKEIEKTFIKFKQHATKDYKQEFFTSSGMNHIEARIISLVARLFPEPFKLLGDFCGKNRYFIDKTIEEFDRGIQFYLSYLDYIEPLKRSGLRFCYPEITQSKEVYASDTFDLALANKLVFERKKVVLNDFQLVERERIFLVSGPNQGGKTTFARIFGQLHYLATLGLPVPGSRAKLYLCDGIFTHFEKEEKTENLRGKLQDDLIRIKEIMDRVTPRSIVILNEIFTSTSLKDAAFLSRRILERVLQLDLLCVWVTFIVELSSASDKIVSLVSTVIPDNPELRTYKIVRANPDGLSYALSLAKKHGVTYKQIKERITGESLSVEQKS